MSTKAQLKAMQFSGLNDQDQWVLLNATTDLKILADYNKAIGDAIVEAVDSGAIPYHNVFALNYAKKNGQINPLNLSNSPSLQDKKSDAKMKSTVIAEQLAAKIFGMDLPATTPNPALTPLPQPGPTPVASPVVGSETESIGKSATIELTARDKQLLLSILNIDKDLMSVGDRKLVELVKRQVQNGAVTQDQLNRYYKDILPIYYKARELEWIDKSKADSETTATWGTEIINNQSDYSSKPGSFGKEGNMKDNACGYMAINNANQVLGVKTDYGHTAYVLNSDHGLTTLLGGRLGMNPFVIGQYYRSNGYHVDLFFNSNNIPKTYDAYIMLYLYKEQDKNNTTGGHYIAVTYNPSTDKFTAYNNNTKGTSEEGDNFIDFLPADQKDYCIWGIENSDQSQILGSSTEAYIERY